MANPNSSYTIHDLITDFLGLLSFMVAVAAIVASGFWKWISKLEAEIVELRQALRTLVLELWKKKD